MAENTSDRLDYLVSIELVHQDFLRQIRHWTDLKVSTIGDTIWIKDFTYEQIASIELKSIPFTKIYYIKDDLVFPIGSLLPTQKLPNFFWTPIGRAFPIKIREYNHNFFGIHDQVSIRLVATNKEEPATILYTPLEIANQYIQNASAIRLQNITWSIVNNDMALFFGEPILPLDGKVYWLKDKFILPVGFHFEFPSLTPFIASELDPSGQLYIWWMDETNYCLINPDSFVKLNISSWRQTVENKILI